MSKVAAAVLTLVLLVLLVYRGLSNRAGAPVGPSNVATETEQALDPLQPAQERVRLLMEATKAGDVEAYLASFSGPLQDRFKREVAEQGQKAFAARLRETATTRKSHALFAPEADGPEVARLVVESVYLDRNERQTFRVEQIDGRWLITGLETARSHQPASKFGTMATFESPEGIPVQAPPEQVGAAAPAVR